MSDENYRRMQIEGAESGRYDRVAYEALRLGRVDDIRKFMLEGLLPQTLSDIVTATPELSYRAVEWFVNGLIPTEARVCPNCNQHHEAIPMHPCPENHRPPTILEALTLLDAHAQGYTIAEETSATVRLLARNDLPNAPLIKGVANAVLRKDDTLTFYKKPQMRVYGMTALRAGHARIKDSDEKKAIIARAEVLPMSEFLGRHPSLSTQFYAPTHFSEPVTIRLPQSEYGHPLCVSRNQRGLEVQISNGQPPMPVYVRER